MRQFLLRKYEATAKYIMMTSTLCLIEVSIDSQLNCVWFT